MAIGGSKLTSSSWVPLGALLVFVTATAGGVWKAAWMLASIQKDTTSIQKDLDSSRQIAAMERASLRQSIDELKTVVESKTSNNVSNRELDNILERFADLNPEMRVPKRRP